jgi:Ni,Fe-hydrogenase maturation factor
VDAGLFTSLARELYDKRLSIMICSIRGENFDVGEKLSSPVLERADRAAREIIDWIESVFTKSV